MKTNWTLILISIALLGGGIWFFVFRKKKDNPDPATPQLPPTNKPANKTNTQTQLPKLSIKEQNQQNLAKWIRLAVTYKIVSASDYQGDKYLQKAYDEYKGLNYVQPLSEIRMAYYNLYKSDMVADLKAAKGIRNTSKPYAFFKKA